MVRRQLSDFRGAMERDGAAQRAEVAGAVGHAIGRGKDFVDATLQLSNVAALRTFLLGTRAEAANLRVVRGAPQALQPSQPSC